MLPEARTEDHSSMAPQDALAEAGQPARHRAGAVVNDFSIQVATVNGSGSQTANLVLLRSIFQMGIPVSGKNLFPSNIAGLPTWYTIRANPAGYIGRKKEIDFLVAMNPETAREDAEICRRMNDGRRALWKAGRDEAGPYQSPMEDGMQHFHEFLRRHLDPRP